MRKAKVLIKNISVNFLAQGLTFAVSFVTTPIIYHQLGEERFGLLMLFVSILGWFVLADLGIIPAFIKYLAEGLQEEEKERIFQTVWSVLLLIVPLAGLLVYLFAPLLINQVFQVSSAVRPLAVNSLKIMSLSFVFSLFGNFATGVPRAKQKFEIANIKSLFLGLIIPLGSVFLLYQGFGFQEIVWLYVGANFAVFLLFLFICKQMLPKISFSFRIRKKVLKKIFSFAGFKSISRLTAKVSFQLNHFIVASFLSVSQLSFYAVPAGIGEKVLAVLPNLTLPIFPLSSELEKGREKRKMRRLYKEAVRLSNLLMTPIFCFLFFFSRQFLRIWMGKAFAQQAGLILQILSVTYLLASYPAVPATIAEGSGKPELSAIGGGLNMLLMLVFGFLLIPRMALQGAAWSMFITRLIQVPIFLVWVSRKIADIKSFAFYWKNYLKILLIGVLAGLPLLLFFEKINNFAALAGVGIIYLLLFGGLSILLQVVTREDLQILKNR